jgi:hypothetical protein
MSTAFSGDNLPFPGSLAEFQRLFPDDLACARYLEVIRWRNGFVWRLVRRTGRTLPRGCSKQPKYSEADPWPNQHVVTLGINRISMPKTSRRRRDCQRSSPGYLNSANPEPVRNPFEMQSSIIHYHLSRIGCFRAGPRWLATVAEIGMYEGRKRASAAAATRICA